MTGTKLNEIQNPLNVGKWLTDAYQTTPHSDYEIEIKKIIEELDTEIKKTPTNKTELEAIRNKLEKATGIWVASTITTAGTTGTGGGSGLTPIDKARTALKSELKRIIDKYGSETSVFKNFEDEVVAFNNNTGKKNFRQNATTWKEEVDKTPADGTNTDILDKTQADSVRFGFAQYFVWTVLENKTKNNTEKKKMIDEYFTTWKHGEFTILTDKTNTLKNGKSIEENYKELSKVDNFAKERQKLETELQAIINEYKNKKIVTGDFENELDKFAGDDTGGKGHWHNGAKKWRDAIKALGEDNTKKGQLDTNDISSIKYGFAEFFVISVLNGSKKKEEKKDLIDEYFNKFKGEEYILNETNAKTELGNKSIKEKYGKL